MPAGSKPIGHGFYHTPSGEIWKKWVPVRDVHAEVHATQRHTLTRVVTVVGAAADFGYQPGTVKFSDVAVHRDSPVPSAAGAGCGNAVTIRLAGRQYPGRNSGDIWN
jgi:hypothetical protein